MTAPRSAPAPRRRSALVARLGFAAGRRRAAGDLQAGGLRARGRGLERGAARGGPGRHHARARAAADRAGLAVLGAGGGLDRAAAEVFAESPGRGAVPGRLPGQPAVPAGGLRDGGLEAESGHLAEPADGVRHPVVHPVQRGGGRIHHSQRTATGLGEPRAEGLAAVAPGLSAGRVPQLHHRRDHRQRRLVERQHRVRVCELGRHR